MMSTVSGGSTSPRQAGSRREERERAARRAAGSTPSRGGGRRGPSDRAALWFAVASIVVPIVTLPGSFFVWFGIIELGSYPGDHPVSDLVVGLLLTALVHALLVAAVVLGVLSVRRRRRAGRIAVAGWVGVALAAAVIVYWELLVSPWLLDLWNKAFAA